MKISQPRKVSQTVTGVPTSEGAGVNLTRVMGIKELSELDPFLLLDEFHSDKPDDYIAGFPDHPHRGFETVTYMIAGRVRHKDNAGHEGVIEPGCVQWMTAGRGIIHSEMPEQENGLLWGFQIWINLPASKKMQPPNYQEFDRDELPLEVRDGNVTLHVIAGKTSLGTDSPIKDIPTQPIYFNISMPPNTEIAEPVAAGLNSFVYVYVGSITITDNEGLDTTIEKGTLAVFDDGDGILIKANNTGAKLMLLAAQPINEPIVRGGPFVMNTREEIQQAFTDLEQGKF